MTLKVNMYKRFKDVLKADLIKALRTKIKDPCESKEKLQKIAKEYSIPIQFEGGKTLWRDG